MAKYTKLIKLEDGEWGARIRSPYCEPKSGQKITVIKRNGDLDSRTIDKIIEKETEFCQALKMDCSTGYYIVSLVQENFTSTWINETGHVESNII